jgi:hypothetical protein
MSQVKLRIYADTSVIGGCLDEEFRTASCQLMDLFRDGQAILALSQLTVLELQEAPTEVRAVLSDIPEEQREYLELSRDASELAERYISEKVIGAGMKVDAQHIAIATLARVDVLVSWNFKHIVNLERIHGYNAVNLRQGYPLLEIRSPMEVLRYGKED